MASSYCLRWKIFKSLFIAKQSNFRMELSNGSYALTHGSSFHSITISEVHSENAIRLRFANAHGMLTVCSRYCSRYAIALLLLPVLLVNGGHWFTNK